jgi:hypothetical protein
MKTIFDLIRSSERREGGKPELRLGLRLKIGDQETICPLTSSVDSYEALESEVQTLQEDLGTVMKRAKDFLEVGRSPDETLDFDADMAPEEVWALLSEVDDEGLFVETFNNLEESRRREIAEHVLTHCNIFTGQASVFSSRYDNESGFME